MAEQDPRTGQLKETEEILDVIFRAELSPRTLWISRGEFSSIEAVKAAGGRL
jgi:hypothetical protein